MILYESPREEVHIYQFLQFYHKVNDFSAYPLDYTGESVILIFHIFHSIQLHSLSAIKLPADSPQGLLRLYELLPKSIMYRGNQLCTI